MRRQFAIVCFVVSAILVSLFAEAAAVGPSRVGKLKFLGTSRKPVRGQVLYGPDYVRYRKEVENRLGRPLVPGAPGQQADPLAAAHVAAAVMNPPALTFEGISNQDQSALSGFFFTPPDTVGDVGPDHYVQMVNTAVRIFNKDGTPDGPAFLLSDLFPTSDLCGQTDDGDPIVLYDELADRWLLSQFAVDTPSFQCIAISQTGDPDPDQLYFVYSFENLDNSFADYPKLGVWPDGYYMTTNNFGNSGFVGAAVTVFERDQMLTGDPALYIQFPNDPTLFGMLPADVDGASPPASTPNYVAAYSADDFGDPADRLRLFNVTIDWETPLNSSLAERAESPLTPAAFDLNLCGLSPCIRQKGTTQRLDSLAQMLMFRLQYRNMGATEKLVLNHTVDANGSDRAGVRYYQLSRALPAGSFGIQEQSTFSPDSGSRWMGSAAMDKDGNLAVGYSVSSSDMFPAIRYAGRLAGDPTGLAQGENTLFAGGGSQKASNRWGDYSALSVDPSDDCTFWYTTQYFATSENVRWNTRIGSFRFGLGLSPSTLPLGFNGQVYSQQLAVTGGGAGPFTFSIEDGALPNGLSLSGAGLISGTPNDADGVYTVIVGVVDNGNPTACTGSGQRVYTLRLGCLYCDDFEDGTPPAWTVVKPSWTQTGGEYRGTAVRKAISEATPSFAGCSTCTVEADMETAGGTGNILWLLGWYTDKGNTLELLMKQEVGKWILKQRVNGAVVAKKSGLLAINPNQSYRVVMDFDGSQFTVSVDGAVVITMTKAGGSTPSGTVGFQVKATTGAFGSILVY